MAVTPLLNASVLNSMRTYLYGRGASLTFYTVTPAAGETQIGAINSDWYAQRKSRTSDGGVSGAVTVWLAESANVSIDDLRSNASVALTINGQVRKYRVAEITEMQQLGSGWVLHCEPLSNTV